MKRSTLRLAAAALLLSGLAACGSASQPSGDAEVLLRTTAGDIRLLLDGRTPHHRDNFLRLVREGFYDSLLFHRVIQDFMIQAGDPDSRHAAPDTPLGSGEAGEELPAEILYPALAHTRGALAAARTPDAVNPERRSSSCQFYIVWGRQVTGDNLDWMAERLGDLLGRKVEYPDSLRQLYATLGGAPHLDGQYTVFGRVVEGLEVVERIQHVQTDRNDRPTEEIRILRAEVVREPETTE